MRILAFDTSTPVASVAVLRHDEPLCEIDVPVQAKHGETLLPRIDDALAKSGLGLADIDLLAVGIGPGSFTGVRVGLATAKGLCLAVDKPLRGVVSLRTLARGAPDPWPVVAPVLDAFRGEVYLAAFARDRTGGLHERLAPLHAPPEQAAQLLGSVAGDGALLLCGDGARRYAARFTDGLGDSARLAEPGFDLPRAVALGREARFQFEQHGPSDLFSLEPLYLRPSDAVLPSHPLRVD